MNSVYHQYGWFQGTMWYPVDVIAYEQIHLWRDDWQDLDEWKAFVEGML